MVRDPVAEADRSAEMAGRGVGDLGKRKAVLDARAGLAVQAGNHEKHIRHETPQQVNSFQTTYLLNIAVTANCCAVQQKYAADSAAPTGGADLQRLQHGELDDLDDHDEGDRIGQDTGHVEQLEQHL